MRLLLVFLAAAVLAFAGIAVEALSGYRASIPNGMKVTCNGVLMGEVGHVGTSSNTNQFGKDFKAAGHRWTSGLCQKDSDGDGFTNGQELGDPNCVWTKGSAPTFSTATHPGIASCVPSVPTTQKATAARTTARPTTKPPVTARPTTKPPAGPNTTITSSAPPKVPATTRPSTKRVTTITTPTTRLTAAPQTTAVRLAATTSKVATAPPTPQPTAKGEDDDDDGDEDEDEDEDQN
jgi:hypothetical protein